MGRVLIGILLIIGVIWLLAVIFAELAPYLIGAVILWAAYKAAQKDDSRTSNPSPSE